MEVTKNAVSDLFSVASVAAILISICGEANAGVQTFSDQSAWNSAVIGPVGVTTFDFSGPTETSGKASNDQTILPSYSSQGVDFLPFSGTNVYPSVLRNQQFQITHANSDGLLVNNVSPNPTTDLEGRAIRFHFNKPVLGVGAYFNQFLDGDGGYLEAFNSNGDLIGQTSVSSAGSFVGLVADHEISEVHIVNTFGPDINFGIYDLQFSAVPEPMCLIWFGACGMLLRRGNSRRMLRRSYE